MTTLQDLLTQQKELEQRIKDTRQAELSDAITNVKALISQFGLTQQDIFGTTRASSKRVKTEGAKVAAKYRDPETGKEWSGRGLAPKWMNGKDKAQFLIK